MNKRLLVLMAVSFLLGILFRGEKIQEIFWIFCLFLFINVIWRIKVRGWRQGVIYLVILTAAFLCGVWRMERESENRNRYEPFLRDEKEVAVQGDVYKKEVGETNRYYLNHCYLIGMDDLSVPVSCNQILVYLNTDDVSIGNTILVNGTVKTLESARNEGNFDEKKFYQSQKIDIKCYGKKVRIVTNTKKIQLSGMLFEKRKEIEQIYLKILGEKSAGVLSTMLLGERGTLDAEVKELYQKSGISHILAISGLHISMIGMGMAGILQKCGVGPGIRTILSASAVLGFAALVGAGISTKRAVLMFFLLLFGNLTGRSYDSLTALAFVAILILWENPFVYAYSGFQLSFLAVLGVNGSQLVIRCKKIKRKWCRQILSCALIQVFTIPVITWCYFEIPIYANIANLLILPTVGWVLFLGIVGGILGSFYLTLGWLPIKLAGVLLSGYEWVCLMIQKLPGSVWITGKPAIEKIFCYYVVCFLVLGLVYYREKISFVFPIGTMMCVVLFTFCKKESGFQVKVLDVGQGDGIYVESDKGSHFFIDGGSVDTSKVGKYRILPFLKANGIKRIDCWFVSHCDADHINGLIEVLEADYPVKNLFFSGYLLEDEAFTALKKLAVGKGCGINYLGEGERLSDGSMSFEALYPKEGEVVLDRNAGSLVLLLETEGFRALLTGDIGEEEEKELKNIGEIDWYKAAHHGSKTSNSKELLHQIHPKIATISYGKGNTYGHPGKEAIENIRDSGAKIYETAKAGQVTITRKRAQIFMETYLTSSVEAEDISVVK